MQKTNNNLCVLEETQKRWARQFKETGMIYLYAMTGYGKSSQVSLFANQEYKEWERLSASDEEFIAKLDSNIDLYMRKKTKFLLVLDDIQWVFDENQRKKLFEIILKLRKNSKLHIFLVSRAAVPDYLHPFQVTRQLVTEDCTTLTFEAKHCEELLMTYPVLRAMPQEWHKKVIEFFLQNSFGYPLGLNAFYQRLSQNPEDMETAKALAMQDIGNYLAIRLFGEWTKARCDAAIRLSVYEKFNLEMAERILGKEARVVLQDFLAVGSFMEFKAPDIYWFQPFFREFLEKKLQERYADEALYLYEQAGKCYEEKRDYEQALRCYEHAECQEKIVDLIVYLSENAEGCDFAHVAYKYLCQLPAQWEQREPRVLGAKVMLAAYRMQPQECEELLERLRQMAEKEKKCVLKGDAMSVYVRTAIACPYDTADKLKDNMLYFVDYVKQNGFHLNNIMPTGNMPSLMNGGLDLCSWINNRKLLYPVIKIAAELLMGKEAVGIADASMGEALYELNQSSKSMAYLTKALSASNNKGSIRVQYAVTAIMARLFQSEGQAETAEEILGNLLQKIERECFSELLPNVHATMAYLALLKNDTLSLQNWLENDAKDEYQPFYITIRYQLFMKARVYVAFGKYIEALYIVNLLEEFAELYQRTYFHAELLILKAIILYRREEEWKEALLSAVKLVKQYKIIRIFADQGVALLPLWKQIDWESEEEAPENQKVIMREMKQMAKLYPNYLKGERRYESLSKKEREVIGLMAEGYNNGKIAEELGITLGTAKFHVANIMKKLGAENRTVAVKIAQEEGFI